MAAGGVPSVRPLLVGTACRVLEPHRVKGDRDPLSGGCSHAAISSVSRRSLRPIAQGCAVDVVDGPVIALTTWFRWDDLVISALNLLVIGLLAAVVAVALVPMSAVAISPPAGP